MYLLPGISEIIFVVTAQHRNVSSPIAGIASHTGNSGWATSPPISHSAMNIRKKMCIRYMPKVSLARLFIHRGALWMQVNNRNAPKVANNTLGVQNSHDHSIIGVSICKPGTAFHQKLHAVNRPPMTKLIAPTVNFFR